MPIILEPNALDLGGWEPFIHRPHIGWLNVWPGHEPLIADLLAGYTLGGQETLAWSDNEYYWHLRQAFKASADSVRQLPVDYHGAAHPWGVTWNDELMLDKHDELAPAPLPIFVRQSHIYAAARHDQDHPGAMFRENAVRGTASLSLPHLEGVSVEWVTSIKVDQDLRAQGFHPLKRLFIVLKILATTFGQNFELGQKLGLDRFVPVHWLELLIAVADIAKSSVGLEAMGHEVQLQFGAVPATKPAENWEHLFGDCEGFFGYALTQFEKLDTAAGVPICSQLGFDTNIREQRALYARMRAGQRPVAKAIMWGMMYELGVNFEPDLP